MSEQTDQRPAPSPAETSAEPSPTSPLTEIAQMTLGMRDCVVLLARAVAFADRGAVRGLAEAFERQAVVSESCGGPHRAGPARDIAAALRAIENPEKQRPFARLMGAERTAGSLN